MANTLLATPRRFSMQQVFYILLRKPIDKSIIAYLTDTKTSGLENTMDMTYPTGSRGNVYIGGGFAYNRRATFNVTVATWNTDVLAIQNGTEVYTGSTTVTQYDVITADNAGNYYTTFTAQGIAGTEIGFVYIVANDGTYTKTYTQVSTDIAELTAGQFAYNAITKQITFADGDAPLAGETIVCAYTFNTASNAQRITISGDAVPPVVLVSAYGVAKDICTGELFPCVIEGQAQVDGNWNFDLSADGEPAVQNLSMEFVKGCIGNELYTFTVYTEDEDETPLESITLSVPTGDLLGIDASVLATGLEISESGAVAGTLNYVSNYTGFSSNTNEQNGYYFPFQIDIPADISDNVVATFQVNNKTPKPLDLTDGKAVIFMGATEAVARSKHITVNIDWDGEAGTKYPTETFVFNMTNVKYAPLPTTKA